MFKQTQLAAQPNEITLYLSNFFHRVISKKFVDKSDRSGWCLVLGYYPQHGAYIHTSVV